jgi:hypothetical protein
MHARGRRKFQWLNGALPDCLGAEMAMQAIRRDTRLCGTRRGAIALQVEGKPTQALQGRVGVSGVMRSLGGINFPKPGPGCRPPQKPQGAQAGY